MRRIDKPMALASVRWLSESEGGRHSKPPGPSYASTAVFVLGGDTELIPGWPAEGEHFSVLLDFGEEGAASNDETKVEFMSWSLVADYLHPGATFLVMEGPRAVAEAHVTATFDDQQP